MFTCTLKRALWGDTDFDKATWEHEKIAVNQLVADFFNMKC